jgi:diguanylate cyclase
MNLLSLPDIAGMLVLMGVLDRLRNRHQDERVDGWLLGLTYILVEMIATAIRHHSGGGSGLLPVVAHVVALDSYLLAAVTFGWAARRDLLAGNMHVKHFVLPAIPMLVLTTVFGMDVRSRTPYLAIISASLASGLIHLLFFARLRSRSRRLLILIHLTLWLPMLCLAVIGQMRWTVYWGLACLYLLVAFSFRRRMRPGCIGPWVIMISFAIWAMCFLVNPLTQAHPYVDSVIEQVWNIQKFFVVIGMLLVLLEDETQRRKNEAMHDPLTGLPNRRLFDDRLTLALERSRRSGLSSAVFAIDLNGFKGINDRYGHQMGDLLLTRVAEQLKCKVRGTDTIARCGGDEFFVIVNDLARPESCRRIAETLRAAIDAVDVPELVGPENFRLSGSIGYAVYPGDAEDGQTLYQLADLRMYEDKQSGETLAIPA